MTQHHPDRQMRRVAWIGVVMLTALCLITGRDFVVGAVSGPELARPATAPAGRAPSLAQLNRAIALADGYLDGLYKPVSVGAVQSEAYGLPIRAYLPGYQKWVLLGEGHTGQCVHGVPCTGPTSITAIGSSRTTERYKITFDTPGHVRAVTTTVAVNWAASAGRFGVTIDGLASTDPRTGVVLWLDQERLAAAPPAGSAPAITRTFPLAQRWLLRSLRYTVRHATQEAYLRARLMHNAEEEAAFAQFLTSQGYRPGVDIRAALFDQAAGLDSSFPFTTSAYPDCRHLPAPTPVAYPYTSKVCLVGVSTFLLAGRRDPFLQESEALLTLGRTGDPAAHYPLLVRIGMSASNPRQTANALERQWAALGLGIPACSPVACETNRASGLRTFEFGALETLLGYAYGDGRSRTFADAAAARAVAVQIDTQGLIRTATGVASRPAQAGAFPIYWGHDGEFVPSSSLTATATERLSMPAEYSGISISDSETTFDGWAFLTTYRCAVYGVGCDHAPYGELVSRHAARW